MQDKLTFSNVCHSLGERKYDKNKIPDDIKLFIELAACFFTVPAAAAAAPAAAGAVTIASVINAISKKGKIIDAAKRIYELLRKKSSSYEEKYQSMQESYTLLWVAAFFDAFEKTVPQSILQKIALNTAEKESIASPFYKGIAKNEHFDPEVKLPGTIYSIDKVYARLEHVYTEMAQRLEVFITDLAFSEEESEQDIRTLDTKLKELPQKALDTFKGEYINLCAHFGEFAIFLELEKEKEKNIQIESQLAATINLINNLDKKTDIEFQHLTEIMLSLGEIQRKKEVKEITDHIKGVYQKAVKRPIIDSDDEDHLIYPSIEESFVPQHYKILEYTSRDIHLEFEKQWKDLDPQTNMLDFWIKYLIDPQNISRPVLILGDPGGGKSLLTEIISASICSDAELVVRIPLRDYSDQIGEKEIENIICQQIEKDGDSATQIHKFKWITGSDAKRPTTIIFDGYDEIQQATGLAYPKLLETISEFQDNCREENRPVRIIITSRRTLIDKATVPIGTLVMKLLPFEPDQQDTWINTWNNKNHEQLSNANLKDFKLPKNNKDIKDLAKQPLLLLMLAMFDANFVDGKNALQATLAESKGSKFSRMRLYNDLIERFIRRELLKGEKKEKEKKSTNLNEQINAEMEKLGIAALGMFVREKLNISIPELRADFRKLKAKTISYESEKALDAEEVFLGSFFFIHDSRKIVKNESEATDRIPKQNNKDASFVFLHKTFYEFLIADYILGQLFGHVIFLSKMKKVFGEEKYKNELNTINEQLYISLCGSALCAEPEITAMISEWWSEKADAVMPKEGDKPSKQELLTAIGDIIDTHAEFIRTGTMVITKEQSLLSDCPITQRNALYILNLITIMILLNKTWTLDIEKWRFLAQYIKLFSPIPNKEQMIDSEEDTQSDTIKNKILDPSEELPLRFMALFDISCNENQVEIKTRNNPMDLADQSPLNARSVVYQFMQDHISNKIYSLHSSHTNSSKKLSYINELTSYDRALIIEQQTRELQHAICHDTKDKIDIRNYLQHIDEIINNNIDGDVDSIALWIKTMFEEFFINELSEEGIFKTIDKILFVSANTHSYEWNYILTLLLDYCMHQLSIEDYRYILWDHYETLILDLAGSALYKYAQLIEQNIYFDQKCIRFYTSFYEKCSSMSLKEIRSKYPVIETSPQWAAGLLKLMQLNQKISDKKDVNYRPFIIGITSTIINQYSFDNQQVWKEMPYLLQECIKANEIETARSILNKIVFDHDKIFSKEIFEYIKIAGIIESFSFLLNICDAVRPMLFYNRHCMKLLIKTIYILLTHNQKSASTMALLDFVLNYKRFRLLFIILPVDMTNLVSIEDIEITDERHIISLNRLGIILDNIEYVFQQSPQTAINFLHKHWNGDQKIIQRLIKQAKLNGLNEYEELLKKLPEQE